MSGVGAFEIWRRIYGMSAYPHQTDIRSVIAIIPEIWSAIGGKTDMGLRLHLVSC
jgi:hypothetical protein